MSVTSPPVLSDAQLDDRYTARSGPALLGGIQALVRLLIEQRRLDAARGLNTGMYVSGYPGSPLGGLDREIARASRFLEPLGVEFEPAVNEELAATAVAGTQLVGELPGRDARRRDRVLVRQGARARSGRRRDPSRQRLGHRATSAARSR